MNRSDPMPARVRYQERWNLMYYLRVFAQPSGQLLGHLVDISTEGAMIISDKPLAVHKDFILSMELPNAQGKIEPVVMSASIIWSKLDVNPYFTDTGIKLIEPSTQAVESLHRLIKELKSYEYTRQRIEPPEPAELNLYLQLPE